MSCVRNIMLTIAYDGTCFNGWQIQRKSQRTVQGEIKKVLERIFSEPIKLIGSGRTDSGVHALGQVANFKTNSVMLLSKMKKAINGNLPEDIAIIEIEEVFTKFHAQYSAKIKTYRYAILNGDTRAPQQRHFCLLYPYKLNLRLMREGCQFLVGRKDFKSFQSSDPKRTLNDTIRTIKCLTIKRQKDYIYIEITANGFLYKMVRNIVGTLLDVGIKKILPAQIKIILSKKDRTFASAPVKAHGLTLYKVEY